MVPTQIENHILIDRSIDLITPMMIRAIYEALLDEVFGKMKPNERKNNFLMLSM